MNRILLSTTKIIPVLSMCFSLFISDNALAGDGQAADKAKKDAITLLYTSLIAPKPMEILGGDPNNVIGQIFDKKPGVLKGRVTPAGTYDGVEGAEEYFWGLGGTIFNSITHVNIKSLVVNDNMVAVQVDINFCQAPWNNPALGKCGDLDQTKAYGKVKAINPLTGQEALKAFTLTQTGFFKFNPDNKVVSYDLSILNLGDVSSPQPAAVACAYLIIPPGGTVSLGGKNIDHIPTGGHCTNFWNRQNQYPEGYAYKPLTSTASDSYQNAFMNCLAYMDGDAILGIPNGWPGVPVGSWYKANSNTQVCRNLHMLLTQYRPEHCGHSGPKGLDTHPITDANGNPVLGSDGYPTYEEGVGVCTPHPYEDFYKVEF